jgi:PIN domain nuclease of toxin-antitoxin system
VTLLLDTHAFLWWVAASGELSRKARSALGSARNECFVSVASGWEIAIKVSLGKLRIEGALDRFLPEQLAANGFQPLAIDLKHAARVATLPFHHRDPFDRLLVAQALEEDLAVVTADPVFAKYGVSRIW